jgi:hypothetical protein
MGGKVKDKMLRLVGMDGGLIRKKFDARIGGEG